MSEEVKSEEIKSEQVKSEEVMSEEVERGGRARRFDFLHSRRTSPPSRDNEFS